jgi:hypothetical protein
MADQGVREVHQALEAAADAHQLGSEKEERDGQQQELVGPSCGLLRHDDERNLIEHDQIGDGGEQHREGDRNVQRHQRDQPQDQASRHEEVASPPVDSSGSRSNTRRASWTTTSAKPTGTAA